MAKSKDSSAKLAIFKNGTFGQKSIPKLLVFSGSVRFFLNISKIAGPIYLWISGHQATSGKPCVHGCGLRGK
jgi:hypothetical protein